MKIFFASRLEKPSASGRQRLSALRALGHEVREFSLDGHESPRNLYRRARNRMLQEPFTARDMARFGEGLLGALASAAPELVWLEKPLMLLPAWLAEARRLLPHAQFVCFQDDDPFGTRRGERMAWKHFIACIGLYDVHFVKRQANCAEFSRHGARHVLLFMHGSHPELFHPSSDIRPAERHDLVFVGTPHDHRVGIIRALLGRHRLPLHVYGPRGWRRTAAYWLHRERFHPELGGEPYARVLSASKIALGFVSSSNRDEYSMRTFEIPSCGALLLAERTPAHQELFQEGVEAEFFEGADECADKCRFYLRHESLRQTIARRGYERCLQSDYSLVSRMRDALERLDAVRESHPTGPSFQARAST